MTNIFSHSGDVGDLIYSLPTIRACGGGDLILYAHPGKTAHGMTVGLFNKLKPLLEAQPYIHSVRFSESKVDTNLNGFRDHSYAGNLSDMHLATMGLSWEHRVQKWLNVPDPLRSYSVILIRTQRYLNPYFNWKAIHHKYKDVAGFIGTPDEHALYEKEFGAIRLVEAYDFMTVARYIAGCKLFIGNPTAATAIAEGLKHPQMVVQVCPHYSNAAYFNRFGCIHAWDSKLELPEIL